MLNEDYGKLILRVAVGVLILFHGISKLFTGIGFIEGMVQGVGLPASLAYLVFLGEVIAPIFLILGVLTRIAALIIVGNMLVAVILAHTGELFTLAGTGGYALELQAMYLFSALAIIFLGGGRFSVAGAGSKWH